MNTKKILVATIAAFLLSNILTTLWYLLTDKGNYVPFRREEINYALLITNHLLYAFLMVHFFVPYYSLKPTKGRAFQFGLLLAAVMFIPQALVVRAIWTVEVNLMFFANITAHLVIGGVMAVVIAIIHDHGQE